MPDSGSANQHFFVVSNEGGIIATTIYLDNNATTRLDPRVAGVMHEVALMRLANPASQHREGARARRLLQQYRISVLQQLGAKTDGMDSDQLLWTSGGTEANNLALFGLAQPGTQILVSSIEHPSITAAAQHLMSRRSHSDLTQDSAVAAKSSRKSDSSKASSTNTSTGNRQSQLPVNALSTDTLSTNQLFPANFDVRAIPVDNDGVIRLNRLEELLKQAPTSLVCVMAANNETGVIQPIEEACGLAHQHGARFHCDAIQWIGKRPTEFRQWGVDSLSITAHKIHGPVGIGGLILRSGVSLQPMLHGGFQQDGLRPGTESVVLAAGFAEALSLALGYEYGQLETLRRDLESQLLALGPEISINGGAAERLPHTSNVAFGKLDRQAILLAADMQGLCLSAGSACASGSSEPSPVLAAMGASKHVLNSSIRISLARDNTPEELAEAVSKIGKIYAALKK